MSIASARGKGIGGHTLPVRGQTNDWITPRFIIDGLGRFDLDPCQSLTQPWPCAEKGYTILDDGLSKEFFGRVYCNPPYGDEGWPFMEKLAAHGNQDVSESYLARGRCNSVSGWPTDVPPAGRNQGQRQFRRSKRSDSLRRGECHRAAKVWLPRIARY